MFARRPPPFGQITQFDVLRTLTRSIAVANVLACGPRHPIAATHAFLPQPARPQPILVVDGLTVSYGAPGNAVEAVNDISFSIGAGDRVAIVGESGSGKTTLALALAGFLRGTAAHVSARTLSFDGIDLRDAGRSRLPRKIPGVTMVFQDAMTSLDPLWTVGSQLGIVVRQNEALHRRDIAPRVRHWLGRVGLTDFDRIAKARPYELSGGMRQRVMLAIAIASRPRLLIADEPTSALDASVAREVMDLMTELTEEAQAAMLMVSHDLHLCQAYADRMVVMLQGRLVEQVAAAQIETAARHPYTRGLLRCVPTLESFDMTLLPTLGSAAADPG
jgi:ABC-type glutathione transport system ATPase component